MRKHHSAACKAQVVQELLREVKTITQLATEHGIHPNQLSKWKATALRGLAGLFEGGAEVETLKAAHEAQLTTLYAEIGRLTTQVAWLKEKPGLPPG